MSTATRTIDTSFLYEPKLEQVSPLIADICSRKPESDYRCSALKKVLYCKVQKRIHPENKAIRNYCLLPRIMDSNYLVQDILKEDKEFYSDGQIVQEMIQVSQNMKNLRPDVEPYIIEVNIRKV